MMSAEVLARDSGAVRILTLNRPEKLNAINLALTRGLIDALASADTDDTVGCVIVTGAGRGFCAGADLDEFKLLTSSNPHLVEERAQLTMTLHGLFNAVSKPIIAAVNGYAMGGGAGLALACDITLAADTAKIGYPEVKRGVVPAIVMANLVRTVGRKKAFELVVTGEAISATQAYALGMVNDVVPDAMLLATATALGEQLASQSREAIARTKALFYRVADVTFADALDLGRHANERMRNLKPS